MTSKIAMIGSGPTAIYTLERFDRNSRANFHHDLLDLQFDTFIDAIGQRGLPARDIPFPKLLAQGVYREAATAAELSLNDLDKAIIRTGGADLDDQFRPFFEDDLSDELYRARDIGEKISEAILERKPLRCCHSPDRQ